MTAIVSPPVIDDMPPAPLPTDSPADFSTKAFATVAALEDFVDQANASAAATNQNATAANERAVAADLSKVAAGVSETNAAVSAASALTAPGTSATSTTSLVVGTGSKALTITTGKAFAVGQQVVIARTSAPTTTRMFGGVAAHDSSTGAMTVTVTSNDGTGTFTDWTVSLSPPGAAATPPEMKQRTITGNDTVVAADRQKIIVFTGVANATLSFTAAATLGDGHFFRVQNATLFNLTVDPNGSELIDGLTSYVMYPGEVRDVRCDGAAFNSVVINAFFLTATASGTWTKPPGYRLLDLLLWDSGAGGGNGGGTQAQGGAGGACLQLSVPASALGATVSYTIAAGGAPGATSGAPGSASSFGTYSTANGTPFTGGAAGGFGLVGGNSPYGGGGGGGTNSGNPVRTGGTSTFAGNGAASVSSGTAPAAGIPAGGGGASLNGTGSPGGRGELRLWGVI